MIQKALSEHLRSGTHTVASEGKNRVAWIMTYSQLRQDRKNRMDKRI